jgi:hypothetical protein
MMMGNETKRVEPPDLPIEDEDHDGWGPIRPRRSSMPPDHHAVDVPDRDSRPIGEPPHKQ